ncbi:MAG: efflux RND transporter periplasmic adaptor subunit, partial [Rhodanobacter sp.]
MLHKRRRFLIALTMVVVFASVYSFADRHHSGQLLASTPPPPVEVDVANVLVKSVSDWQNYSGRLQAIDYVYIRALVPGTITAVYFKDGQLVKKGDPLFLIDPRPYAAATDQAVAQVAAAKAREAFAAADYERAKKLILGNAISKRDFDQKSNGELEAIANMKAAEAALENARVNLGYAHIDAPVSGRMSRAEFTVGNIVSAGMGSPPLTT